LGLTDAMAVVAEKSESGRSGTSALRRDGTVRSWGDSRDPPLLEDELTGAVSIARADGWLCAVLSDGTVRCSDPTLATELTGVVSLSFVFSSQCFVLSDGTVKCQGQNVAGVLGDGTDTNSYGTPVDVAGVSGVRAVSLAFWVRFGGSCGPGVPPDYCDPSATGAHACAILSDGTAWCWGGSSTFEWFGRVLGESNSGELGTGSTTNSNVPVQVAAW
jgi:alpha-tubulin suppressor-like RCC1 family protein